MHDHGQKSPVEFSPLERTDPARYRHRGRDPPPPHSMLEHRRSAPNDRGARSGPTLNRGEGGRVLGSDSARGPCAPAPPAIFDHGLIFPAGHTTKPTQRITAKKVRILRKRTDQNVSLRRNFNHFRSERFLNFLGIRKVFEVLRQVGFLVWPAGKSRGADLGEIVQFEFPRSKETVFARVRARLRFIRASATGNAPTSPPTPRDRRADAAGRAFSVRSSARRPGTRTGSEPKPA